MKDSSGKGRGGWLLLTLLALLLTIFALLLAAEALSDVLKHCVWAAGT